MTTGPQSSARTVCPKCGRPVSATDNFCEACRRPLSVTPATGPRSSSM